MVDDYLSALKELQEPETPDLSVHDVARRHSSGLHWDEKLKREALRSSPTRFSPDHVRRVAYRPFVKQQLYADQAFAQRPARIGGIFPDAGIDNLAICVPGVGSTKPFSALAVDTMPDLKLISKGQCFPRYRFKGRDDRQVSLLDDTPNLEKIDNITDTALEALFRVRYGDSAITKDRIFDYVYGILHAVKYRGRFANDLLKELPRIPFAPDFHLFAEAGNELMALHIGYESCEEFPLAVESKTHGDLEANHFLIGTRSMRFAGKDRTVLVVNDHVRVTGIPAAAHRYRVNGRTPLEWFIDRYRVKKDSKSGIINDPNGWFEDLRDLITAIRRIVHVSITTTRIVEALPEPFDNDDGVTAGDPG